MKMDKLLLEFYHFLRG